MDTSFHLTVSVHKHVNAHNFSDKGRTSFKLLCVFDHTGGTNSKEEGRGDMGGLKRSYEMMDVGMSRVPPIRDSLSASEGKHNTLFFFFILNFDQSWT